MCGYHVDHIFSEKISVSTQNAVQFAKDRPQLMAMLDYVREGIEIAKRKLPGASIQAESPPRSTGRGS